MNNEGIMGLSIEDLEKIEAGSLASAIGEFFGDAMHWAYENGGAINDGYVRGERF